MTTFDTSPSAYYLQLDGNGNIRLIVEGDSPDTNNPTVLDVNGNPITPPDPLPSTVLPSDMIQFYADGKIAKWTSTNSDGANETITYSDTLGPFHKLGPEGFIAGAEIEDSFNLPGAGTQD